MAGVAERIHTGDAGITIVWKACPVQRKEKYSNHLWITQLFCPFLLKPSRHNLFRGNSINHERMTFVEEMEDFLPIHPSRSPRDWENMKNINLHGNEFLKEDKR